MARLLLAMAEHAPTDQVRLRITQREIAELVSVSRQTVSLTMNKLKRLGALAMGRGEVSVKVPILGAALARIEVG